MARLEYVEGVTWQAALTATSDPDILRRSLFSASDTTSFQQLETTLELLDRRESELEVKVGNRVDLVEEAKSSAAREAYEARINERTAEIEEVRRNAESIRSSPADKHDLRRPAESIVDRVNAERSRIESADTETRARIAKLIGLQAYVVRVENSKAKMVGAVCVPAGLTVHSLDGLGEDNDEIQVVKFIEDGSGCYPRQCYHARIGYL